MRSPIEELPQDVLQTIFTYLPVQSILICSQVSKSMNAISLRSSLWQVLVYRDFWEMPKPEDWKKAYIALHQDQKAQNQAQNLKQKAVELRKSNRKRRGGS